ncbi:hypothetical protein [Pseudofrankia asymbiotica]|uniref:Uncharacterized protein n=1 Tax=Pseudofrankia asymbiotica TaxID=1834516 RepID=A0A1V2HZW4_9ACTN|nr:hypothetical protein [Pseudofrankia asymbiotica]ONH22386.1 hypothetical protein BL253_35715 [Pseudofrankia asymbiotica]
MTTLEDRLRDATAATADLMTTDRAPGRAPVSPASLARQRWYHRGEPRHRGGPRVGGGRARRLTPALVGLVVLLLVGGSAVVLPQALRKPPDRWAAAVAEAGFPARYFLTNISDGQYQEVAVRDALTGAVTATVQPRSGEFFTAVEATGDPRVFHAFAYDRATPRGFAYRLTIDGAGHAVSLVRDSTIKPIFGWGTDGPLPPQLPPNTAPPTLLQRDTMITPLLGVGGTRVYVIAAQQRPGGAPVTRVVELDAATGRQLRVLFEEPKQVRGNTLWTFTQMALDPAGKLLMVVDGGGAAYRIDIATAKATRLPFLRGTNPNSIAW